MDSTFCRVVCSDIVGELSRQFSWLSVLLFCVCLALSFAQHLWPICLCSWNCIRNTLPHFLDELVVVEVQFAINNLPCICRNICCRAEIDCPSTISSKLWRIPSLCSIVETKPCKLTSLDSAWIGQCVLEKRISKMHHSICKKIPSCPSSVWLLWSKQLHHSHGLQCSLCCSWLWIF